MNPTVISTLMASSSRLRHRRSAAFPVTLKLGGRRAFVGGQTPRKRQRKASPDGLYSAPVLKRRRNMSRFLVALAMLSLLMPSPARAQKADAVVFENVTVIAMDRERRLEGEAGDIRG